MTTNFPYRAAKAACGFIATAFLSLSANAAFVSYADRASWAAAAGTVVTDDFEGIAVDSGFVFLGAGVVSHVSANGVTYANDTATNAGSSMFIIGRDFYYTGDSVLSVQTGVPTDSQGIDITIPVLTNSIAFDFCGFDVGTMTVNLGNGTSFSPIAIGAYPSIGFFGIVGGAPSDFFSTVNIVASPQGVLNLDDFAFARPLPGLPVAPTVLLLGLGAIGFWGSRRNR